MQDVTVTQQVIYAKMLMYIIWSVTMETAIQWNPSNNYGHSWPQNMCPDQQQMSSFEGMLSKQSSNSGVLREEFY